LSISHEKNISTIIIIFVENFVHLVGKRYIYWLPNLSNAKHVSYSTKFGLWNILAQKRYYELFRYSPTWIIFLDPTVPCVSPYKWLSKYKDTHILYINLVSYFWNLRLFHKIHIINIFNNHILLDMSYLS